MGAACEQYLHEKAFLMFPITSQFRIQTCCALLSRAGKWVGSSLAVGIRSFAVYIDGLSAFGVKASTRYMGVLRAENYCL